MRHGVTGPRGDQRRAWAGQRAMPRDQAVTGLATIGIDLADGVLLFGSKWLSGMSGLVSG
jgi:hypothetical protein